VAFLLVLLMLTATVLPAGATAKIVYRHACTGGEKRVALTFDDGPHPRYTPKILDILAEFGVEATFFAVGTNAETYPQLIHRILAEGHELGNHTYNHYHTPSMSGEALEKDVRSCDACLRRITGEAPRLFRPPEGVCSEDVKRICAAMGYTIVLWSVDTRDWAHPSVGDIVRNVRANTANGSIILMHDFIGKNSPTPEALRQIIPMLQESGYEFVTVSRLLEG